jgi:hypothetical protein
MSHRVPFYVKRVFEYLCTLWSIRLKMGVNEYLWLIAQKVKGYIDIHFPLSVSMGVFQ